MTPTPRESEATGVERKPARAALRERTIAELVQLHEDADELARTTGVWSGVGARRRLRDARNAETDLLRVLGFSNYGEFRAFVGPAAVPSAPAPPIEAAAPEAPAPAPRAAAPAPAPMRFEPSLTDREQARTRELERALGAARVEIEELRTKIVQGPVPAPGADGEPHAAPVQLVQAQMVQTLRAGVESAVQELAQLREATQDLQDMIIEIGAELIAARLEILVAQRRMQAQQSSGPRPD